MIIEQGIRSRQSQEKIKHGFHGFAQYKSVQTCEIRASFLSHSKLFRLSLPSSA
jgi:hypothetical protein